MNKKFCVVFLLFFLLSNFYGVPYRVIVLQDKSLTKGYLYLADSLTDSLRNVLIASKNILLDDSTVIKKRSKNELYIMTGSYIASEGQLIITLTLTYHDGLLCSATDMFEINDTLLDNFRLFAKSFIANEHVNNYQNILKQQELPQKIIDTQSREIKRNKSEAQILFAAGQTYAGLGFLYNDIKTSDNLNIASPINRWKSNTSFYFRFELARKYNLTYSGGFVDMVVPFIFDTDYFFSYSRIRLGYEYGYKGELFFCPSIDYVVIMYSKTAKDNPDNLGISLLTAGIGFDIRYIPRNLRVMIEGGLTLFPPYLPFVEQKGNGDDGPVYPFAVSVNGTVNQTSQVFPLSPRVGTTFFNKSRDFGFFASYSLIMLNVSYNTVVKIYSGDTEKLVTRYYGDEYTFCHEFRFGVMYQKIIK